MNDALVRKSRPAYPVRLTGVDPEDWPYDEKLVGTCMATLEQPSDSGYHTLIEALLAAPPDLPFITVWTDEDEIAAVTFGEFIREAKLRAAALQAQGLSSGDTVIVIMPQNIPLMTMFVGAMLLGAVPAILAYPSFKADPAKYKSGLLGVSQNLQARFVVVDEEFPEEFVGHLSASDGARVVRSNQISLGIEASELPDIGNWPDRLAFIQHSAGTTGLQKGVALTHRAVLTQLDHLAKAISVSSEDRIYSWLPLYHDMGLIACFMLPMVYHLPIVMQSPLEWVMRPGTMLQLISSYRCTMTWVPNFVLQFLARRVRPEDRSGNELSSLRALINCSEPVRAQSIDEFVAVYEPYGLNPDAIKSSYAMAENVFGVTQSDINGTPRRIWVDARELAQKSTAIPVAPSAKQATCFVSSGRCLAGNGIRIVSSDGGDLGDYEVGEIAIRSDSLFDGYYNRADLTSAVCKDGWYWTGDLGFCVEGELFVTGRKKDLIIVAGKNIYPQDIEEIVSRHPAVHDGRVVAFGVYNEELGTEDIMVVAELENDNLAKDTAPIERDIRDAIVSELDVAPRAVFLKPTPWIVKSTAGKPARSTTREKLLREHFKSA
jgi:acyl-CoA synthetase (AMP-forming)/AMP-acid ligase II